MKIIHITGRSDSGKTTLIQQLIPALAERGRVGVVKHLGDHTYALEKGKDTTEFFSAGAEIAVGIDAEKSVATIRTNNLDTILSLLNDNGMDFAIVEGFKKRAFAKVVLGDLKTEKCVLRDPVVSEILASLDKFDDYQPSGSAGYKGME